jgi:hypothetical protein
MKAIFAVTALAAAISGQALAADTEATTTFNGAMEVDFTVDMAAETKNVNLQTTDDANDGGAYGLYMDVAVVNGPFSGSLTVQTEDGTTTVDAGDIVVTDGPISFGQVGDLTTTDDYTYKMEDANDAKGVDAAIRYNVMEGFDVQLEGSQTPASPSVDDYGIGAAYSGAAGDVSYVVDAQVRLSDSVAAADSDAKPYVYYGAGVAYTTDLVTVKGAFNSATSSVASANDTTTNEYGLSVSSSPVDGLTVGFDLVDLNLDSDTDGSMIYKASGSFVAGSVTLSGYYEADDAENNGDEINAKVEYAQDMIAAYAGVTLEKDMVADADAYIEAGVSYTVESGIVYAADYETQGDATNNLKLSAKYSF